MKEYDKRGKERRERERLTHASRSEHESTSRGEKIETSCLESTEKLKNIDNSDEARINHIKNSTQIRELKQNEQQIVHKKEPEKQPLMDNICNPMKSRRIQEARRIMEIHQATLQQQQYEEILKKELKKRNVKQEAERQEQLRIEKETETLLEIQKHKMFRREADEKENQRLQDKRDKAKTKEELRLKAPIQSTYDTHPVTTLENNSLLPPKMSKKKSKEVLDKSPLMIGTGILTPGTKPYCPWPDSPSYPSQVAKYQRASSKAIKNLTEKLNEQPVVYPISVLPPQPVTNKRNYSGTVAEDGLSSIPTETDVSSCHKKQKSDFDNQKEKESRNKNKYILQKQEDHRKEKNKNKEKVKEQEKNFYIPDLESSSPVANFKIKMANETPQLVQPIPTTSTPVVTPSPSLKIRIPKSAIKQTSEDETSHKSKRKRDRKSPDGSHSKTESPKRSSGSNLKLSSQENSFSECSKVDRSYITSSDKNDQTCKIDSKLNDKENHNLHSKCQLSKEICQKMLSESNSKDESSMFPSYSKPNSSVLKSRALIIRNYNQRRTVRLDPPKVRRAPVNLPN